MPVADGLGALILNGGASTRMGADKGALDWGGVSAVQRCRAIAAAVGADPILVVGPGGEVEDPRLGPVGGVLAGAAALRGLGLRRALVLAVDAPTLRSDDLAPLLVADEPGAAFEGLHLPMVITLAALPEEARSGWPLGRLADGAGLKRLAPAAEACERLRGANTPLERERLLEAAAAMSRASGV